MEKEQLVLFVSSTLDIWHMLMWCVVNLLLFFLLPIEKSKDLNKLKEDVAHSTIQLEKIRKVCIKSTCVFNLSLNC